jgi:hypothetical protein
MTHYLYQTLEIYGLTIVISMLVAYMIKGLNKLLFYIEDTQKRRHAVASTHTDGKAS